MKFSLKKNLLLGTATAATQIEGGDENNMLSAPQAVFHLT